MRRLGDYWHYGGYQHDQQAGNAGWNDQSGISNAARQTLISSAGITPPSSKFVLQMLAVYLVVLVPLNWLVFRTMGRVEWAWIAAPIIAIAGAFAVAKMASLDIGFVRSNTQVALLEVYNGHQRGHLSPVFRALHIAFNRLRTGIGQCFRTVFAVWPVGGQVSKERSHVAGQHA